MTDKPDIKPLIDHLCQSTDLTGAQVNRIIDDVIAYFSETPEDYVRRRHVEIKQETGANNAHVFARIEAELAQRVFACPALTQRQIRRIIYG